MDYVAECAGAGNDGVLRHLLGTVAMPGPIALAYRREPSFWGAALALGAPCEAVVVRHRPTNDAAAMGARTVHRLYVGGQPERVEVLGHLRVHPGHRGRFLLRRGFDALRELHERDGRPLSLTTIVEGNEAAERLLAVRPRRGMPRYRPVGRILCAALPTGAVRPARGGPAVERAQASDLHELLDLLRLRGARRQFFPALDARDLDPAAGRFRDLSVEDFLLARAGGRLVGAVALWDQRAFKQVVVQRYEGMLGGLRPAWNVWRSLTGRPGLPQPGREVPLAYAAFLCLEEPDGATFRALLGAVRAQAFRRRLAWVLASMEERDPLAAHLAAMPCVPYWTRLYVVEWEGENHECLDERILHVEMAYL